MKTIYVNIEFKDPVAELKTQLQRSGARINYVRRNSGGEMEVSYIIKVANPQKDIENILAQAGGKNVRPSPNYNGARYEIKLDDMIDERVFKQKITETLRKAGYRAN